MTVKEILNISESEIVALDGKDGKTLFDSRQNRREYIEKYNNGKVLHIWSGIRTKRGDDFYATVSAVLMLYVSHNSWLESEVTENE